ncbi:PREDICTED: cytoplasmic dynein 2 light intermediate chain 1 isoform X2 [Dinoponera quadriceps]|uniref:Cytoplasmic dynein 2 light intermediate chain 1 n=1 Tax=Dinoponera quadriceps TaxID=609295 RepID=A0A6P3WY82_DINQU|nr:PREDICTED: cytoplasmic dynein 2 light intermediate chain 1 isoform X2 [Dinoponera quadriceps]
MSAENREESMREIALRIATEEEHRRKTDPNETHERSIIILGSKGVGKTTMVYRFLEKEERPKPTIAMDYSFGRKTVKSLVKNIVHVWEVGHLASSLVSVAMTGSTLTHSPHHTVLLMMLDLSRPGELWASFEETISVIRSGLKMSYDAETVQKLRERRITDKKKDVERGVDPVPMKICIVGGRYDEFKEFDLGKKEFIGKTLRAMAHNLGASLYYYSSKDKVLVRRIKDLLSHYGFGSPFTEEKCTDYEKPLMMPAGADSFGRIDLQFPQTRPSAILDTVKQIYVSRMPQVSKSDEGTLEDPSNDPNFNEPIIDRLRTQREEESSVLLNDMMEGRMPKIPVPDPF